MSSPANSTSPVTSNIFSFSIGTNFVDVTALTTLIGSTAAESLVLGNHGPAGIAWATTSSFGSLWVIRACIGAAVPDWLRETMGMRTSVSDMALGMELPSSSFSWAVAKIRARNVLTGPLAFAIYLEPKEALHGVDEENRQRWSNRIQSWKEVYAYNLQTSLLLNGVPDTGVHSHSSTIYGSQGNSLYSEDIPLPTMRKSTHAQATAESERSSFSVYTYAPHTFYRSPNPSFHIIILALSLVKLGEFIALRAFGSGLLGIIVTLPWVYFFTLAIFLQAHELLARAPEGLDGHLDILAGRAPSIARSGGMRKIVIGVQRDPRMSTWWQIVWAVGAFVCTLSLTLTYMLIGQQTNDVVLLWAGFQLTWMLARMAVYHFAEPTDAVIHRMVVERPWNTLPTSLKTRVLELVVACAQYQALVHPRGFSQYNGDSFTSSELASILVDTPFMRRYPLPHGEHINDIRVVVNVQGVIGDTVLASAAWVSGSNELSPKDLYDCCIISLSTEYHSSRAISVPAVRFFIGTLVTVAEMEFDSDVKTQTTPQFIPKGSPNAGSGTWWYYVPCENGLWLLLKRDSPGTIIGNQSAEIVNDAKITATLARGNLKISLTHVNEVKHAARLSETARQAVMMVLVG